MYTQIMDPMTGKVSDKVIKRDSDGAFIPLVEGNRDYRVYKEWLAEGNQPNPPAPIPGGPSSAPKVELPEPMDPAIKQYIDEQLDLLKGG